MVWNRLALPIAWVAWLSYSAAWLYHDKLPRDGDEDGHVGAAEIFKQIIEEQGLIAYLKAIWIGDYGDYPNLFSGLMGGWWHLVGGQPEDLAFRLFPITGLMLAAIGMRLIFRSRSDHNLWAGLLLLLIPMANGLVRHAMPEGLVMGLMTLCLGLGLRHVEKPSLKLGLVFGICLGIGALSKHNFILLSVIPLLWLFVQQRKDAVLPVSVAAMIAGPWYIKIGLYKDAYVQSTLAHSHLGWQSIFAHPTGLLWEGLGPILTIILFISLRRLKVHAPPTKMAYWWLFGGLISLCILPKQYPRLLLPLLPAVILIVTPWISRQKSWIKLITICAATVYLHLGTIVVLPTNPLYQLGDDGCKQQWLRPPSSLDFGLQEITETVINGEFEGVIVSNDLVVPCAIQTTHNALYHLEYRLRRHGFSGQIIKDRQPGKGPWLMVSWKKSSAENNWQPQIIPLSLTE